MKLKLNLITSTLAASCFCLHAAEPQTGMELPPVVIDAPATPKANGNIYRQEKSYTEFIGLEVWNLQNEKLGKIKAITVDLENSRVVDVVMTSGGGLFGFGGKTTSILPRALKLDASGNVMRLNMSKAQFDAAPGFKTAGVGHAQTTEFILGLPIHNTKGQYLGKVGNIMMDLPNGRIVQVVNDTQAMGGDGSYVIQPSALRYNPKRNGLLMDRSFAELKNEPIFKWAGSKQTAYQQEYASHDAPSSRGLQSRQNATSGMTTNAVAMGQGQRVRDAQKTSRIELAIKNNARLSPHARNVKVVTLNSQTTLRGHVSTAEGKRKIGEIAAQAGKAENVSNLLVVTAVPALPSS